MVTQFRPEIQSARSSSPAKWLLKTPSSSSPSSPSSPSSSSTSADSLSPDSPSHGGGHVAAARRHREPQGLVVLLLVLVFLVVLLLLVAVAGPEVGAQPDPAPASLLGALEARALDAVFVGRVVRPVAPRVVVDDVDPIKRGRSGQAPLAL